VKIGLHSVTRQNDDVHILLCYITPTFNKCASIPHIRNAFLRYNRLNGLNMILTKLRMDTL